MKDAKDGCRHTPRPTRAGSFSPQPAFFSREIEHRQKAGLLSKHRPAKFNGVLAGLAGEFIHGAFDREHIVVRADAAPKAGRHRRRLGLHISTWKFGMS